MKLTWLGHSCFLVEQDGYKIAIDPYTGVAGYPELRTQAHEVVCTHHHFDHDAVDCVELLPKKESPFTIHTVESFHDEEGGALRGPNTIHVLSAGGVTIAHLGDLGHRLSEEQVKAIGKVDGVLVPVGGYYTVDVPGAKEVCEALNAKWIIPMHYLSGPYGQPVEEGVETFLALWDTYTKLDTNELEITDATSGVIVPKLVV